MPPSYEDIVSSYNLGRTDATLGTAEVPNIVDYGLDELGNTYITYTFFRSGQDVESAHYYGADSGEENSFVSGYNPDLENAIFDILNDGSYWSSSFDNTIKVNFIKPENLTNPAHQNDIGIMTFGQVTNSLSTFNPIQGGNPNGSVATYTYDANTTNPSELYGDIWFNMDHQGAAGGLEPGDNAWTDFGDITKGTLAYKAIYEEIAHALGIDFLNMANVVGVEEATQKYSVTSYIPFGHVAGADLLPDVDTDSSSVILWGEDNDGDGNQDVLHAYGLQLYDIAALQILYGAQTEARTGHDTYKLGQGLGRDGTGDGNIDVNDKDKAFIYTIWDGAGIDTIDASDFDTFGAKINLNAGAFSSIGADGKGGAVYDKAAGLYGENVAIAYDVDIENAIGTKNSDTLIGNSLSNVLVGGAGNDDLIGGAGNDVLDGGADDDFLVGGDGNDTLIGGGGNDTLEGGKGTNYLDGGEGQDTYILDPAVHNTVVDTGTNSADQDILKITVQDGQNVILTQQGDDLWVVDTTGGAGNETLLAVLPDHFKPGATNKIEQLEITDGTGTTAHDLVVNPVLVRFSITSPYTFASNPIGVASAVWDPLVVDLDGDGVQSDMDVLNLRYFDLNVDGFAEAAHWLNGNDGFLVRDLNANGRIDNGAEMFGTAGMDGFTMLGTFDGNSDGLINASDAIWSSLLIWKDENADGQTQSGELQSLSTYGITSFNVANVADEDINIGFHDRITHSGIANTGTGTLEVVNVNFFTGLSDSRFAGEYDLDPTAAVLPDLIGRGFLADMHIAMSLDNNTSNPDSLISIMDDVVGHSPLDILTDYAAFKDRVTDLLYRWAGVENYSPTARGPNLPDARILYFMEKFYGGNFVDGTTGSPNPQAPQAASLLLEWDNLLARHMVKIIVQNGGEAIFGTNLTVNFLEHDVDDNMTGFALQQDFIDELEAHATSLADTAARKTFWLNVADLIHMAEMAAYGIGDKQFGNGVSAATMAALDIAVENSDPALSWSKENHIQGGSVESIEYRYFYPSGSVIEGDDGVNSYVSDPLFLGTANDDIIYGYGGNDLISGGAGNDIIYGGDGNDDLSGGAGDNILYGEAGDDILRPNQSTQGNLSQAFGGDGNDIIYLTFIAGRTNFADGGEGNDTYMVDNNTWMSDPGGLNDTIFIKNVGLSQFDSSDLVFERLSDNTLFLKVTGFGNLYVQNHFNNTVVPIERVTFGSGATPFDLTSDLGQVKTIGNHLSETIYGITIGGSVDDIIEARGGNDTIYAGIGNDNIKGEDGNDTIYGEDGNDTIDGGLAADIIDGGDGDDIITTGNNPGDIVIVSSGNDAIMAASNVQLKFADGVTRDDLSVSRLSHTSGQLVIAHTIGQITVTMPLTGTNQYGPLLKLSNETIYATDLQITVNGTSGNDTINPMYTNANPPYINADMDEVIYGLAGNDTINGGDGNDILHGGAGIDVLNGGSGVDTASYALAASGVIVDLSLNTVSNDGDGGTDTLSSIENATGSAFADTITGNSSANTLDGGAGNDILKGNAGNDILYGGAGSDQYIFNAGHGQDTITDTDGADDIIKLGPGIVLASLILTNVGNNLEITFTGNATDKITIVGQNAAGTQKGEKIVFDDGSFHSLVNIVPVANDDSATTNENTAVSISVLANDTDANLDTLTVSAVGAASNGTVTINANNTVTYTPNAGYYGADSFTYTANDGNGGTDIAVVNVTVNPVYNVINGTSATETIVGTSGKDSIYAYAGNDTLRPLAGNDIVYGGDGNDIFYSYTAIMSTDLLFGENGNDKFHANGGNDSIDGGSGTDEVVYTFGSVAVTINMAAGTVDEGQDSTINDTLAFVENATGSNYNDIIIGDGGVNQLSGANGNDLIYGGDGGDNILGNNGDDVVYGENGNDFLYGYDGNDVIYGGSGSDVIRGYAHNDIIYGQGGADYLYGGTGADTFAYAIEDLDGSVDVIDDFSMLESDALDVSALLSGYDPLTDLITDFVQITDNGTNSFLAVDTDGGANNFVQIATLNNVTGLTNEDALETSGNLITV